MKVCEEEKNFVQSLHEQFTHYQMFLCSTFFGQLNLRRDNPTLLLSSFTLSTLFPRRCQHCLWSVGLLTNAKQKSPNKMNWAINYLFYPRRCQLCTFRLGLWHISWNEQTQKAPALWFKAAGAFGDINIDTNTNKAPFKWVLKFSQYTFCDNSLFFSSKVFLINHKGWKVSEESKVFDCINCICFAFLLVCDVLEKVPQWSHASKPCRI